MKNMAYRITIHPSARHDIIEAIEWYNERQPDLGFRFYHATQTTLQQIKEKPEVFAIRYKTIRTAIVRKFPYMIHFMVDQQTESITVLAVLCTYRNPDSWIEK